MAAPNSPPIRGNASLAAYRWLLSLSEDVNMDRFDYEMALKLWTAIAPRVFCCFECGDDVYCRTGLDYWMTGIIIFLLKFYGHGGMSRQDRMNIRYLRARFLNSPENRREMIEFELEMIDMLHPVLFRIQNEVADDVFSFTYGV